MNWVAVDTGANGAFAWVGQDALGKCVKTDKIPDNLTECFGLIRSIPHNKFIVEAIRLRPSDLKSQPIKQKDGTMSDSQFAVYRKIKMIKNQQKILTLIELAGKKYISVEPSMWQKEYLSPLNRGLSYSDRKKELRNVAAKKYAKNKVYGWNADAILILDWIYRQSIAGTEWLQKKMDESNIK